MTLGDYFGSIPQLRGIYVKSNNVYLSFYQAMVFMCRIDEMRKATDNFDDELAMMFEKYVIERASEIVLFYPQFLLKVLPHANKHCLTKDNFDYLCTLTEVNQLDKQDFKEYLPKVKQVEEEAKNYYIDNDKIDNGFRKRY